MRIEAAVERIEPAFVGFDAALVRVGAGFERVGAVLVRIEAPLERSDAAFERVGPIFARIAPAFEGSRAAFVHLGAALVRIEAALVRIEAAFEGSRAAFVRSAPILVRPRAGFVRSEAVSHPSGTRPPRSSTFSPRMEAELDQSAHVTRTLAPPVTDMQGAWGVLDRLRQRLRRTVRGRDDVIDLILVALLADGHVLLEDYPGSGKTTLAKALGDAIVDDRPDDDIVTFRRIQFTPDLLPSDVTGTSVFDPNSGRFTFRPGPLFAHVVLADEINRTSPKVQSAMLEAMAEKQTTVDNKTRKLDPFFFVIATQNPLDLAGTFPLPAAQLDRFLFRIKMKHIDRAAELEVLTGYKERRVSIEDLPRVTRTEILDARAVIEAEVFVAPPIRECLVDIAGETRAHESVVQGASTRSLVLMMPALQGHALARQRDHVTADDVEALAPFIFGHRLELAPGSEPAEEVLAACMKRPLEALARATLRRP